MNLKQAKAKARKLFGKPAGVYQYPDGRKAIGFVHSDGAVVIVGRGANYVEALEMARVWVTVANGGGR